MESDPSQRLPRPAVLLDRDGVLIEEVGYLCRPEQLQLLPTAAATIGQLNRAGVPVVVVTNQSAVARGMLTEGQLAEIHLRLDDLLAQESARIDRYEYCPHHPQATVDAYRIDCDCRKPKPGLLLRAAESLQIDLGRSLLVGDKISDLEAGAVAGCQIALVRTGYGGEVAKSLPAHLAQVAVFDSVQSAVEPFLSALARQ